MIRWYHESVEYSKSLPLVEKTINATSASQSTEISCAFFNNPDLRFENVTCLLILFSILLSWTLPLPMKTRMMKIQTRFTSTKYSKNRRRDKKTEIYICFCVIFFLLHYSFASLSKDRNMLEAAHTQMKKEEKEEKFWCRDKETVRVRVYIEKAWNRIGETNVGLMSRIVVLQNRVVSSNALSIIHWLEQLQQYYCRLCIRPNSPLGISFILLIE